MQLDTRGFMDGALKGFDLMERKYARDRQDKRDDERMEMARQNQELGLRQAEQQMKANEQRIRLADAAEARANEERDILYGVVGEDGKRTGGTYQQDRERQGKLADAQLAASNAQKEYSQYQLQLAKKSQYIQENSPLIQNAWKQYLNDGSVDDIFDNEYVKGSAYDPRRYLDSTVNSAFDTLETKLPQVINGEVKADDKDFVNALGIMYQDNVKAVVGQQDPITGKTIKDAKLGGVHMAQDIDPNTPGDQAGIVLTTLVNYGDGKWVAKPITNNRSTDPNDSVKVIPLEAAMKDITSQLGIRRQAMLSPTYQQMFKANDKDTKANDAKYKEQAAKIENTRLTAIGKLDTTVGDYNAQVESINAQADQAKTNLQQLYLGSGGSTFTGQADSKSTGTNVPTWANGDQQKIAFAQSLLNSGYNVGSMPIDELTQRYNIKLAQIKKQEDEARAVAAIDKVNQQMQTSGVDNQTNEQTPYGYDPRRGVAANARGY